MDEWRCSSCSFHFEVLSGFTGADTCKPYTVYFVCLTSRHLSVNCIANNTFFFVWHLETFLWFVLWFANHTFCLFDLKTPFCDLHCKPYILFAWPLDSLLWFILQTIHFVCLASRYLSVIFWPHDTFLWFLCKPYFLFVWPLETILRFVQGIDLYSFSPSPLLIWTHVFFIFYCA